MATEFTDTEKLEPMLVKLPSITNVAGRAEDIHALIARRAYALYEARGHVDGHDKEDWLQGESEVLATLCVGFMELNGDLSVNIGIATCELPQLQVALEPWRLIVSGKRAVPDRQMAKGHFGERPRSAEIFQVVDFPVEVEPSGVKATLSNGLLELRIPKVRKTERSLAAKTA